MFDCDLCSRAFQSRDQLFAHFENDHSEKVQNELEDHGLYMVLEWNVPYPEEQVVHRTRKCKYKNEGNKINTFDETDLKITEDANSKIENLEKTFYSSCFSGQIDIHKCEYCEKTFDQLANLKRHVAQLHKNNGLKNNVKTAVEPISIEKSQDCLKFSFGSRASVLNGTINSGNYLKIWGQCIDTVCFKKYRHLKLNYWGS